MEGEIKKFISPWRMERLSTVRRGNSFQRVDEAPAGHGNEKWGEMRVFTVQTSKENVFLSLPEIFSALEKFSI